MYLEQESLEIASASEHKFTNLFNPEYKINNLQKNKTRGRPKKVINDNKNSFIHKQTSKSEYVIQNRIEKDKMIKEFKKLIFDDEMKLGKHLQFLSEKFNIPYKQTYETLIDLY